MIPVSANRLEIDECKNENEKQFLEQLQNRAKKNDWHACSHPNEDRIILFVEFSDNASPYEFVFRTLRIDFDGESVLFGKDESGLVRDLDPKNPDVFKVSDKPIEQLVSIAADWLEHQLKRPVERHEWDKPDSRGVLPRLWVMADTKEPFMANGIHPSYPPSRIVPILVKNLCAPTIK